MGSCECTFKNSIQPVFVKHTLYEKNNVWHGGLQRKRLCGL